MKIKTLIVDDEPHAIEVIERYIQNLPEIELIGTCHTAVQAFQTLQQQQVELMFLDIKMPGLLGTELVRSLKHPPRIIFTTAYQDYAIQGFDLNAVDYLLKPIPFDRFLKAVDKVFDQFKLQQRQPSYTPEKQQLSSDSYLYLRAERKMIKVNVNDIYWMENLRDYIKVVLKDRVIISKQKISVLEELLPEDKFLRIHRSYIVAVHKVESYHAYAVEILGKELPIGRNYKVECRKQLR